MSATASSKLAPRAGLEPATRCLEGSRSIQLSYRGEGQKVTEIQELAEMMGCSFPHHRSLISG
jgi:hypothetical protein